MSHQSHFDKWLGGQGAGDHGAGRGKPGSAVEPFGYAARRWEALNRPYDRLRALRGLGRALEGVGDLRGAWAALDRALQLVETLAAQLDDPAPKTAFLDSWLVNEIQSR